MKEIIKKILSEGTVPIMSDEGILQIFNYYYNRARAKKQLYSLSGPSRVIKLSVSKERIDNLDFDEDEIRFAVEKEMYRLFGSHFCGDIKEQRPFGQADKKEADDERHGYDNRIYINAPFGEIRYKFIQLYAQKCSERGVACDGKFFHKSAEEDAIDNMILYSSHKNINIYLEILEEIKKELPEFAEQSGSPIASGLNISYYSIVHSGDNSPTYNDWFNEISEKAFDVTISRLIAIDDGFYGRLTSQEKQIIDKVSNEALLERAVLITKSRGSRIGGVAGFEFSNEEAQIFRRIVEKYLDNNPDLPNEQIIETLRDCITDITSLANFGDLEHKDMPISLRESDYEALGLNASDFKSLKPADKKEETSAKTTKLPKKLYPKEKVKEIFNADERQIRVKAMQVGYTFADTEGKTEQELRTMIFDKITLDNESMISILCGGDYQLKRVLVGYGATPKEVSDKSREELERMYIEKVGLEQIITAREEVIKQDEISGKKRTHLYENTLQAMRMERGKNIMESEEFKSLKTKEEKCAFLDKLSATELEDAERYYTNHKNAQKMSKIASYSM